MFKFIHARVPSDIVDPSTTLGIEITDKSVSALCGLGNVDGQHGTGLPLAPKHFGVTTYSDGVASWETLPPMFGAAVQIASDLPVFDPNRHACLQCGSDRWGNDCTEQGSSKCVGGHVSPIAFATSRPDLDSVGAMAVLVLRALGLSDKIDRALVRAIADADSFRVGTWEPCALPSETNLWPRGQGTVDASPATAYLGMIASPRRGDFSEALSLAERVFVIACALCSTDDMTPVAIACGVPHVVDPAYGSAYYGNASPSEWAGEKIAEARTRVLESRRALAQAAIEPSAVIDRGTFVEVRVAHAGALSLGYCVRPVAVAFDQSNANKVTIAGYSDGYLDAIGLIAELNRSELQAGGQPLWGGARNMAGSPQVGGTRLDECTIVAAVERFVIGTQ